MPITSSQYSLQASTYARVLMSQLLWRYWWLIAFVLVGATIASFYDIRLLLATLMLVLIALPLILAVVYFNYALSPDGVKAVYASVAEFDDSGNITLIYTLPGEQSNTQTERVPAEKIENVEFQHDLIVMRFVSGYRLPLVIKNDAFDDASIKQLMTIFQSKM